MLPDGNYGVTVLETVLCRRTKPDLGIKLILSVKFGNKDQGSE